MEIRNHMGSLDFGLDRLGVLSRPVAVGQGVRVLDVVGAMVP